MEIKQFWPGWETGEPLGKGGFGIVYEIHREVFGDIERKALKIITIPKDDSEIEYMRVGGMDEESITNTFYHQVGDIVQEYKIMSKLQDNPNIVHCDDFRYTRREDGVGWDIYIRMELLTPLLKVIDRFKSEEEIIRLGIDLCNGLQACQEHHLIHRDIKPQNIFISPKGHYKLGDFGISRTLEHTTTATSGIGTHSYMAPEVARGEKYSQTVDIYSVGLVLYWLLNECRGPFLPVPPRVPTHEDNAKAWSRRIAGEKLPMPKHGSAELIHVVMKACAFDPEDRYQSAREMKEALQMITQNHGNVIVDDGETVIDTASTKKDDLEKLRKELEEAARKERERLERLNRERERKAREQAEERRSLEEEWKRKEEEKKQEAVREAERIRKQKEAAGKKKLIISIGICICVLVAVIALLIPKKAEEKGGNSNIGLQIKESTVSEDFQLTETEESIPEGKKLIDGTWENGNLKVVALDDTSLWIQITDDRPDQQYENYGTPWEVQFAFGTQMKFKNAYGYAVNYPYRFCLKSIVAGGMYVNERKEAGKSTGLLDNLYFWQTEQRNDSYHIIKQSYVDFLDIEKDKDTYTAVITLPDWFDVSVYDDLTSVDVALDNIDHFEEMEEKGSVDMSGKMHTFYPPTDIVLQLNKEEITIPELGTSVALKPDCDINPDDIFWWSMDSSIATIEDGVVTAISKGRTQVFARYRDQKITCVVHCGDSSNSYVDDSSLAPNALNHTIAAGAYHSVYIRPDGTVGGVGRETDDRRDVSGWSNIISLEASTNTVGLRSDGTVVAAGKNGYGQCDVGGWKDIVDIAVNVQHTVGLQSNGRVVAKGNNKLGRCNVSDWTDIVDIAAGEKTTFGLKSNGTVVAVGSNSSGQQNISGWSNITAISSIYRHVVGLKKDGTVVAAGNNSFGQCDLSGWRDIVQVSAGHDFTVGLRSDGTVVAAGSNDHGQCNVGHWTDIVEISAGQYHVIGKRSDGTYVTAGSNGYGQCNVA